MFVVEHFIDQPVSLTGLVPAHLRVRLNRQVWSTESGDLAKTKQYGPAQNSAFELGVDEAMRYAWPDVSGAQYGRVQLFMFVTTPARDRAVLLAKVNLYTACGVDDLTGLPIVALSQARPVVILARHLNHRVIMPVVGVHPTLVAQQAKLAAKVATLHGKLSAGHVSLAKGLAHQEKFDAMQIELGQLNEQIRLVQTDRLLVLGARANDEAALVPDPSR